MFRRNFLASISALLGFESVNNIAGDIDRYVGKLKPHSLITREKTKVEKVFEVVDKMLCDSFYKKTNGVVPTLHGCHIYTDTNLRNHNRSGVYVVFNTHVEDCALLPDATKKVSYNEKRYCDEISLVCGSSVDWTPALTIEEEGELMEMFRKKYETKPLTNKEIEELMASIEGNKLAK